jgi:preprotein translocase subunit YajC
MTNIIFLFDNPEIANGPSPLFWPFMLAGLLVFYFFIIRPQQKEQQKQKSFTETLKKGSKVITHGGLHGTITDLEEQQATVLIAPKTVVTLQRSSISLELTQAVYGTESAEKDKSKAKA